MRIAILTLPPHLNYGGILQAYALQIILERQGHIVNIVVPKPKPLHNGLLMPLVYIKRAIMKFVFHANIPIWYSVNEYASQHTRAFINKHMNIEYVENWDSINDTYDAVVVGSDQIWRPKYACYYYPLSHVFLDFVTNKRIKKIAYAVSFGTDTWEYSEEETSMCRKLVQSFKAVSVRESSGKVLCKEKFGVEASFVVDPTLLLTSEDYLSLVHYQHTASNIVTYILDRNPSVDVLVKALSSQLSLPVLSINSEYENEDAILSKRIQAPVEKWLVSIADAEYVITDSFHACVFSIIFKKNFSVIVNEARGASRIHSLLGLFGLQDRIIRDGVFPLHPIDYDSVYSSLDLIAKDSMSFLLSSLS